MPEFENPSLWLENSAIESGNITWESPSNIAIVKYWGKHGKQLPKNPSISATLSKAKTTMTFSYSPRAQAVNNRPIALDFLFEGEPNEKFQKRIENTLASFLPYFPFLKQLQIRIESKNSFPHSSGIASSASAMSALALCLCSLEDRLFGTLSDDQLFEQKASYIARLGSGSASRSIFSHWALWGQTTEFNDSNDAYAISLNEYLHPSFKTMRNAIAIVSQATKAVSSSQGHALMEHHPYAENRFAQARKRLSLLISALESGNWETFGTIAEDEALTLHGLMMTSKPSYLLMQPNTLAILQKIRTFRSSSNLPVYFTLDAGPNVHILYPDQHAEMVELWIEKEIFPLTDGTIIYDQVGEGPEEL